MLLSVALAGCETYFVDPAPPELLLLSREHTVKPVDAPVVYGFLFDLNLPDAAECARIKNQLTAALRAVLLPPGREGLELPAQDLSPNCVQTIDRGYPYSLYEAQSNEMVRRYGAGRARMVLFYFNNVALPLPYRLNQDFSQLQANFSQSPQLWALATPEVTASGRFAQSAPWSYSADSRLTAKLEELIRAQLPFQQSESVPAEGFALFTPQELTWARAFKGCSRPSNLSGVNFTYGPVTTPVDAARPPRFTVALPTQGPVPRSEKPPSTVFRFQLEVCRENCERFSSLPPDGALAAWDTTPSCFLTGF